MGLFDLFRHPDQRDLSEVERAIAHNEARGDPVPAEWHVAAAAGVTTFEEMSGPEQFASNPTMEQLLGDGQRPEDYSELMVALGGGHTRDTVPDAVTPYATADGGWTTKNLEAYLDGRDEDLDDGPGQAGSTPQGGWF
jgi:hypothetical protein